MQEVLEDEQLQKLENTLYINFHGTRVEEECTQLITSESHGEKVLRLENCADGGDGTVSRYAECVAKMIEYLHKRFEDITTNDI